MSDATPSDLELIAALYEGDDAALVALRELYNRHAGWLLVRLSRRCSDPDVADSAVQDTFVAIWRKPRSYKGNGDVGAWIWGIGIRRLCDGLRRRPIQDLGLSEDQAAAVQRPAVSAEEEAMSGLEYGGLADALRRLSPELQAVVRARVFDDLTTKEASQLLRIPQGTVKTRLHRAKALLRMAVA